MEGEDHCQSRKVICAIYSGSLGWGPQKLREDCFGVGIHLTNQGLALHLKPNSPGFPRAG